MAAASAWQTGCFVALVAVQGHILWLAYLSHTAKGEWASLCLLVLLMSCWWLPVDCVTGLGSVLTEGTASATAYTHAQPETLAGTAGATDWHIASRDVPVMQSTVDCMSSCHVPCSEEHSRYQHLLQPLPYSSKSKGLHIMRTGSCKGFIRPVSPHLVMHTPPAAQAGAGCR